MKSKKVISGISKVIPELIRLSSRFHAHSSACIAKIPAPYDSMVRRVRSGKGCIVLEKYGVREELDHRRQPFQPPTELAK